MVHLNTLEQGSSVMKGQISPNRSVPSARLPEVGLNWEEHPTHPGIASNRRVLIAEDDPALRDLMARLLAFEGYFVTEAGDALAMLDAVQVSHHGCDEQFDLIVTDVRMPGLTGLEALAILRQSGCNTPTIVVSALPGEMVQPEVQGLNALFLPKPFALENLRRIANRVVCDHQSQNSAAI